MKFFQSQRELITACVENVEKRSRAELVVVIEPAAGRYETARWAPAVAVAFAVLVFHLYSPWEVLPHFFLLDVALAFAVVFWGIRILNLAPRFTSEQRKALAVQAAAARLFLGHRVHSTRERTGILVYGALAERRFEVLADEGVKAAIPPEEWNGWMARWDSVCTAAATAPALVAHLEVLGGILEKHLPVQGDNPNELPNAPIFAP